MIRFTNKPQCPPGTFSLGGSDEQGCSLCPKGYYQSSYGSTFCDKCPDNIPQTLSEGSTSEDDCLTDKGAFLTPNKTREECPLGAVCDEIGVTVETLEILPGKWRTSPYSTSLLSCPRPHVSDTNTNQYKSILICDTNKHSNNSIAEVVG